MGGRIAATGLYLTVNVTRSPKYIFILDEFLQYSMWRASKIVVVVRSYIMYCWLASGCLWTVRMHVFPFGRYREDVLLSSLPPGREAISEVGWSSGRWWTHIIMRCPW
jgi:hypothetical protein